MYQTLINLFFRLILMVFKAYQGLKLLFDPSVESVTSYHLPRLYLRKKYISPKRKINAFIRRHQSPIKHLSYFVSSSKTEKPKNYQISYGRS